jgi:hypothetical protein
MKFLSQADVTDISLGLPKLIPVKAQLDSYEGERSNYALAKLPKEMPLEQR